MFTSLPIVWFAVMDQQYEKEEFMKRSRHYRIGLQDKCFGTKVFWQWFSLGAFKAFILMYICLFA
jgi:hypothetical protein